MNNKKLLLIGILTIIFTLIGSTLAYWRWTSTEAQKSNITFTVGADFSCSADGGGNVSSGDVLIIPTTVNSNTTANYIKRTITINNTISSNKSIWMDLWLNINSLGSGLSSSQHFRYVFNTDSTTPENGVVQAGTFNGKTAGTKVNFLKGKQYTQTTNETYYLWIWLDYPETSSSVMNQSFSFSLGGSCTDIDSNPSPSHPELESGMIPVIFDMEGTNSLVKTISSNDPNWYNYDEKKWANMVLVTDASRANYQNNVGAVINEADILGYFVWIPRYKYKLFETSDVNNPPLIEIAFENAETAKSSGTATGEWRTHPAFAFGNTEVEGFWIGKFELTGTATAPTVKPDVQSLRSQKVSSFFNIIKGISVANGTHGIKDADSHMLKNSEWGAVAYLSHSAYGVGREIYINNSSSYYTGRSGGNVGGSTAINTVYTDQTSTTQYNNYGFYTWDGYLLEYGTNNKSTTRDVTKVASTTGNVYGVYDMSGGAWEYVMGYYSGHNPSAWGATSSSNYAGFTATPEVKYYDNYTTTSSSTACNGGICYGQALSETSGWYGDYAYFVSASNPWLGRGGLYFVGAYAGAFVSNYGDGSSSSGYGARVCLAFA